MSGAKNPAHGGETLCSAQGDKTELRNHLQSLSLGEITELIPPA